MKNTVLVFLMLICFLESYPQVNLGNGLVAYYPFNGNANDASGNGNNAIFNNATPTFDAQGNPNSAYYFNGIDNYIQVPNSPSLNFNNQMSIALKVKPLGYYTGPCYNNMMIMKGDADYLPGNYFIRFSDVITGCTNPTTTDEQFYGAGVVATNPIVQLNQWYDVVWTYDGTTARLYVNCVLQDSNIISLAPLSNTYDLFIGKLNNAQYPYWLNGDLDEVRIYNRALNAQEVSALCSVPASNSVIINDYTEVLGFNICNNELQVADATKYNAGDTVLLIQMKGAIIDSTNTTNFGTVTDLKNAGNYEYNYITQKIGNVIQLKNQLTRQYDIPNGKVQLIRVPYYLNFTINDTLSCLPWDGGKGGVLAFNVRNTLTLNADIDVSGKGFRGGDGSHGNPSTYNCYENQYYYPPNTIFAAGKGEGIAILSTDKGDGKGKYANGGGGGNSHNSGGGGGANAGIGGFGGYEFEGSPCDYPAPFDNRGIGGSVLSYNNAANRIFLGGGGGAGHANNPELFFPYGGNGGGICIINANSVEGNNHNILANGENGLACEGYGVSGCHEGMGGGGGAGAILLNVPTYSSVINIEVKGGSGANMVQAGNLRVGPGGGGGGGIAWLNNLTVPANLNIDVTGGLNGVCINYANSPWGTTPGQNGLNIFSLVLPLDTTLFKPNIDSVRLADSATSCSSYDFRGMGYTNTSSISSWNWSFGDGGTGNQQNTSHTYNGPGNYLVKLLVADINGCMDSISSTVNISNINISKSNDTSLCGSSSAQLFAGGGSSYSWSPSATLNNPNIANPVATPLSTTVYYVTVSSTPGCSKTDSIKITVNNIPVITKSNDTTICQNTSLQLFAGGGSNYSWIPASSLNNPNIQNPIATPDAPTTYYVTVTNTSGCSNMDSIKVNLNPVPVITKSNDTSICNQTSVQLFVTGGVAYLWSPASSLDNSTSATPVASPLTATTYTVKITDNFSCNYFDSVKISILPAPVFTISPDGSVCIGASLQLTASGGDTYIWEPADGLNNPAISNPVASPEATTTYTVTIHENTCNQTGVLSTTVQVFVLPDVKASSSNDLTCSEGSSQLKATGASTYSWSPATGLNNSNIPDPIATPGNTTLYTVAGADINGCINTDTVTVKTDFNTNTLYLMANSFTPNGDGKNDCFGIKDWGVIQDLDFSIYNRFGERVFHTNDAGTCWDGTYRQLMQDADVYVYVIKAKTACGNIEKKGTVTLIR